MKLPSAAQMKYMDEYTINTLGVPSLELMERASAHIAMFASSYLIGGGSCAVFCGSGNNGGDGFGAAAIMKERGYDVRVFMTGKREKMTRDTRAMYDKYASLGGRNVDFDPDSERQRAFIASSAVIIDAMFGTGLNSDIRGVAKRAVEIINASRAAVVAADMPSGVETDTGRVLGSAVRADVTVTFSAAKPGQMTVPGCFYCGRVHVMDIGIPAEVTDRLDIKTSAFLKDDIAMPKRARDAHKGDFGKLLIIAGSRGYTGAPVLSSDAAVRSGAGLVFLGVPEAIYGIEAAKCREAMPFPLPCDTDGRISSDATGEIMRRMEKCDVCLIGPGLGQSSDITALIREIVTTGNVPLVIDADGLNALSKGMDILALASRPIVLTPHDGEFARLGGDLSSGDRIGSARGFAEKHGCILVLKGHRTITAFPDGEVFINTTGNPGMAKGGSGDVLAGIIASLIGQGLPLKKAVPLAVCIHGAAGDACAAKLGEYCMTPSDMIDALQEVMR